TYITGRNTSLRDADGNGRLTLNELGGNPYTYDPNFHALACAGCKDAAHRLDSGLGTTTLDPRTVYLARGVDFSNTITHTAFLEAADALGDGQAIRLQVFGDVLQNDRFVSYGFPGSYRTQIFETRLRYDLHRDFGPIKMQTVAGLSWRYVHANDIIDSPFNVDPPGAVGLGWENNVQSNTSDAGAFITSDLAWDNGLDLTV